MLRLHAAATTARRAVVVPSGTCTPVRFLTCGASALLSKKSGGVSLAGQKMPRKAKPPQTTPITAATSPNDAASTFRPRTAKMGSFLLKEEADKVAAEAAAGVAAATAAKQAAAQAAQAEAAASAAARAAQATPAPTVAAVTTPAVTIATKPQAAPTAAAIPRGLPQPTPRAAPAQAGASTGPASTGGSASKSPPPPPRGRSRLYRAVRFGLFAVVGSSVFLLGIQYEDEFRQFRSLSDVMRRGITFGNSVVRLWRDLYCVAIIVGDYELSLRNLEGEERKAKLKQIHLRSALRLRDLMCANGGIYIKFGQHVAQMQFLLPDEYVETMKPMLNQAPTSSIEEVQRVFAEEFGGKKLLDVFETFDLTPIASASLAQVHFATLKGAKPDDPPRQVAVKVQHSTLEQNCASDIATVAFIIRLVHWFDKRFDYQWLSDEISTNLPLECDFMNEARNSERARLNLRCDDRPDINVPRIHWPQTSKRVVCMERMDGCHINDVAALERAGISFEEVSTLMSQVFSEMIFMHGFVHADPHSGNMLIQRRSATDARPRLILLDHGLYRELSPEFRISYSHLWHSLICGDADGIKKYAQEMNAGEMYPMFAAMLTRKTYDQITEKQGNLDALVLKNDESERDQLQRWAIQYADDVQHILARVPKELLLLLKTNDCLRAIDTQLGTPINSFLIMARYCTKAINQDRLRRSKNFSSWIAAVWATITMEARLRFYTIVLAWSRWVRTFA